MKKIYKKCRLGGERDIRLMEIQPGAGNDVVRCRLKCLQLEKSPPYECLSYMWNALPGEVTICCENEGIQVTSNLHAGLVALRDISKPRVVWVDAVCINQGDKVEKSKQIPLMTWIYSKAQCVLLWLGTSNGNTESAFTKLKLLSILWAQRAAEGAKEETSTTDFAQFVIHKRSQLDEKLILDLSRKHIWTSGYATIKRGPMEFCELSPNNGLLGSQAFEFHNTELWQAVEDLFANPFFSRAWIVQEVSVARVAQIQCGRFSLPWEIFRHAFNGRQLLAFQISRQREPKECSDAVSTVRDARKRFWDCNFHTDLAATMPLFTFSKATDPRDYIYAALGMVKVRPKTNISSRIVPNYTKEVDQVYLEAATHMIIEREDLYLWGRNDPPRRKSLKQIPTWVPDWSVESDQGGLLHFKPGFSKCLSGQPAIDGRRLKVNAHMLDTICLVADVCDVKKPLEPLSTLIPLFGKLGLGLFQVYRAETLRMSSSTSTHSTANKQQSLHLQRLGHAFSVLTRLNKVPEVVLKVLSDLMEPQDWPLDDAMLNIEALWTTLCNTGVCGSNKSANPGFHLFLGWWYFASLQTDYKVNYFDTTVLPKAYGTWVLAASILSAQEPQDSAWARLLATHLNQVETGEDFFATESGYFGRCPKGVAKKGHQIAVLGGAYRPYVLKKQPQGHYHFVSYAYVEGIMDITELAQDMKVIRVEIE